jgi:predicted nucleic acid-binding protein
MIVVLDTNVVVSAAFWPKSEDRRCLALLARRKCRMAVTERILREYRALTVRIGRQECPDKDPLPFLDWIEREEAARAGDKWAALLEREENDPQAR